jgi:hypothetical protein
MKRSINASTNANAALAGGGVKGAFHWGPLVVAEGIHTADRSGPQSALL